MKKRLKSIINMGKDAMPAGVRSRISRAVILIMCAVLAAGFVLPLPANADNKGKTVKVGWYESAFCSRDEAGRLSGYAYEYQLKLAAYTGWKYEYVKGSWPELFQMLQDGDIDMLSDVSYTDERAGQMLFPSLPMGTEEYYIFTSPDNKEITSDDYTSLNGKRIGVNKGSIQAEYYREWAQRHGVNADLVELTCLEKESLRMLQKGELDAYITPDAFSNPEYLIPVCKIGSSDFYFAVRNGREDLLAELNSAMSGIQDENRYYNQIMSEKYLIRSGVNAFLTNDEARWLEDHGAIRVGYQDNYLAFCEQDKNTGQLKGALKDYLDYASDCLENAHVDFIAQSYPTAEAAIEAMKDGEVDCVFPANMSGYDGEKLGIVMTPPLMRTDVFAVIRSSDRAAFAKKNHVVVAVNEGNPNYVSFLLDNFPDWRRIYLSDTGECLKAVADGLADCVLVSSYRYNNIARLCEKYNLTSFDTGVGLDYSFAVASGQNDLYAILSRITGLVPESAVNSALSFYITEDAKTSFGDYIRSNMDISIAVTLLVLLTFMLLMLRSMNAERRSKELIAATEIDDLTGMYTRKYFLQYANRLHREMPDVEMDAIVFDIEQFHSVNAMKGREFGDRVLKTLGSEIKIIADEASGISGRFGADRFDIYCRHIIDYQAVYDRLQSLLNNISPGESIRLRMGVMNSQPDLDIEQMFDMARTACSMSRGSFQNHLIIFDESVREREEYEQRLLNDLHRALEDFEFEVYYQPKFYIQSEPPKLVGAEALIRWRHHELGMIAPDAFIPLLERSGKISEVDKYVWNRAAEQIVRWRDMYGAMFPISVNLSRVDVFDPDLEDALENILAYHGLEHDAIRLEVTETAYTENSDQVIKVVRSLRGCGFEVEMDDFGTGYSSLNMLSRMPVDVLKMDRGFIRNIESDEKEIQLVGLILDIARKLGVTVVAEGVETESQLKLLKKLGCEVVQGYYFSKPLPSDDFEREIIEKHI